MLTLVEAVSLAGDRMKQNDDACGFLDGSAWIIDGATDLHSEPIADAPSDAAWLAQHANAHFHLNVEPQSTGFSLWAGLKTTSNSIARMFGAFPGANGAPRWKLPTASVLLIRDDQAGVEGADLGDCRCFALDADGRAHGVGGPPQAADREAMHAADAAKKAGGTPLLEHADSLAWLRDKRAQHNTPEGYWVFGLQGECADHARAWTLALARPAHILLCTDGFSALVDRYGAYDPAGLIRAALAKGLHALGAELRAIEHDDAGSARHPRWKRSDDATALLLRLT